MKDITQPGERERTYIYRDYFVTRAFPSGYYSTRTRHGRLMADTKQGIKKLIDESIERMKEKEEWHILEKPLTVGTL